MDKVLYDISISSNSVFVFEFVKCLHIGAPPKDPAQKRFVKFWDFRETTEFPGQTTTSGSQLGGGEINIPDQSSTPSLISMERFLDDAAMLHFFGDCLFRSDYRCITSSQVRWKSSSQSASQVKKARGFHACLVIFTDCRRTLQILKPRSSNWNIALMRYRHQQQMLLRQLITELKFCSP